MAPQAFAHAQQVSIGSPRSHRAWSDRLLGKDHKDTLAIRAELATNFLQLGQLDESLQTFREVHETQSESLGPLHQETLTTLSYATGSGTRGASALGSRR